MMTIQDVVAHYLLVARRELSHRYADEVERYLTRFVEQYGAINVADAKAWQLAEFVDFNPKYKSGWTQGGIIRMVKRAFSWAEQMEYIDRNPFKNVRGRSGERGKPVTDEQFDALSAACHHAEHRNVLVFLRLSGARPGELSALTWENMHLDRGIAVLYEHKTAKRTGRARIIQLVPPVISVIERIQRSPRSHPEFVFVNARGNPGTAPRCLCCKSG